MLGEDQVELRNSPTQGIRLVDGMLQFKTVRHLNRAMDRLAEQNNVPSERDRAYEKLGIRDFEDESVRYTDYPGSELFERAFGFSSMRSEEEAFIFSALNEGSDMNSIISRPELKTILNSNGVLKVGTRFLKFYNTGRFVIVGNNDVEALNEIVDLGEFDFADGKNVRKLEDSEYSDFYNTAVTPTRVNYVQDIEVNQIFNANGTVSIENVSFVEFPSGNEVMYSFEYNNQVFTEEEIEEIEFDTGDNIKITATDGSAIIVTEVQIRVTCEIIDSFATIEPCGMEVLPDGSVVYIFDLSEIGAASNFGPWTVVASYGGNTATDGEPLTIIASPGQTSFEIQLTAYSSNGVIACEGTIEVTIECPNRLDTNSGEREGIIDGDRWRVEAKIWVDVNPLTTGKVGSRTKASKKVFIGWNSKRVDNICVDLIGQVHEKNECDPIFFDPAEECESDSGNVQKNYFDGRPRLYTTVGKLYSTHSIEVDGDVLIYTNGAGEQRLNL